jgi:hypothetical protein
MSSAIFDPVYVNWDPFTTQIDSLLRAVLLVAAFSLRA